MGPRTPKRRLQRDLYRAGAEPAQGYQDPQNLVGPGEGPRDFVEVLDGAGCQRLARVAAVTLGGVAAALTVMESGG